MFYGIDIPTRKELIAADQTENEIRLSIGVDCLLYQTKDDLIEAITRRGGTWHYKSLHCVHGWQLSMPHSD